MVKSALRVCPDVGGTLKPPITGHETKKDISMPTDLNKGAYWPVVVFKELKCYGFSKKFQVDSISDSLKSFIWLGLDALSLLMVGKPRGFKNFSRRQQWEYKNRQH